MGYVYTWTNNAGDRDWTNSANWDCPENPGTYPSGDGDTIDIQSSTLPDSATIPDQSGWTLSFLVTHAVSGPPFLSYFLHSTNPAQVQNVEVAADSTFLGIDVDIHGNLTLSGGVCGVEADVVVQGDVVIGADTAMWIVHHSLAVKGTSFVVSGRVHLNGGVIDSECNITLQDGAMIDLSHGGDIMGGIDVEEGATVMWYKPSSEAYAVDIILDIDGAVFDPGPDAFTPTDYVNVYLGGLSGTSNNVSLPIDFACYGAHVTTTGTISTGATFESPRSIHVGAGGWYQEPGTPAWSPTKSLEVVVEKDCSVRFGSSNARMPQLTVQPDATATLAAVSHVCCVSNNGTINLNNFHLVFWLQGDDFYQGSGEFTGGGRLRLYGDYLTGDASSTTPLLLDAGSWLNFGGTTNGHKIVFGGSAQCGDVGTYNASGAIDVEFRGGLTANNILFDGDNFAVTLGPANHTISGDIGRSAGTETGCSLTLDGATLEVGGTLDGDGLAASASGSQVRGGTLTNISASATDQMRLRCRNVTVGAGVNANLLHLDDYARRLYRRRERARLR